MDAKVNDFFNEINEISVKKDSNSHGDIIWRECQDELTGYPYYWNTQTDEVSWQKPKQFKSPQNQKKSKAYENKKLELYVPPKAPSFPNPNILTNNAVKIYSIQENSQKGCVSEQKLKQVRRTQRSSDSDDEKIELITSYGSGSDSESDKKKPHVKSKDTCSHDSQSDEDDEIDILAKIQKRAKELKALGGDVPSEVKSIIEQSPLRDKPATAANKEIAGFSLVAGYSDSEEEDEDYVKPVGTTVDTISPFINPPMKPAEISHSTLFPIAKPVDINDFATSEESKISNVPESEQLDLSTRAFQRKRRIGVSLVNSGKKKEVEESEFKGLGFKTEIITVENAEKDAVYSRFQKGGVMFVKSDVLNPNPVINEGKKDAESADTISSNKETTEEIYTTLKEKLMFLSESREAVSPVQTMLIQAETLFLAMKGDGLKVSYLHRWLHETCSELLHLEKEAAPDGWLLQWDRSHKRYYYQNQNTGESQWEYPQPDITRCDDAMDICTTPPPPPEQAPVPVTPPLPPTIRSPTPPPPPVISLSDVNVRANATDGQNITFDVPLPPSPKRSVHFDGEPLPPGVELPEPNSSYKNLPVQENADDLTSALDSFYSEIAAATTPTETPPVGPTCDDATPQAELNLGEPVKKKKKKVKLAQGLAMKKKGVSQLVEKWKNVQKDF
ncbi:formin-binding protein 4-like [Cylas formicarius]|uniref:formin-binding protein 4-like n=1 Tax=Cylas formicarius TaxID=197179 RepID=UPI002958CFA2|nr:formin-binding protein 4-like [Cylas formicarius]